MTQRQPKFERRRGGRRLRMTALFIFAASGALADWRSPPAAGAPPAQPSATAADRLFVARRGDAFVLGDRPFRVAGVNIHYLPWGSRDEVTRALDDAVAMRANVVRTFVAPIIGSPDGSTPTIWNWASKADASNLGVNGAYMAYWDAQSRSMAINEGDSGLKRIDFILAEAAKRRLRVILAFLDFWSYTGGAPQMQAWRGLSNGPGVFAENPDTRSDYKRLVEALVNRTNSVSGVRYKDDPTLFAWELMNEPDIHPTSLFRAWVGEMAAYVKSLDSRHLLASGQGSMQTRLVELNDRNIDFGTWHGYPEYQRISAEAFKREIADFCDLAQSYGKPVLLEEFGLAQPDEVRGGVYSDWLSSLRRNAHCAGWVAWRLVSRQDGGALPYDHDGFDIHNDDGTTWRVLHDAALALTADNGSRRSAQGERN